MGLTLHYDLRLPDSASTADVRQTLTALRDHALTLPFEFVSPLQPPPGGKPRKGWLTAWASMVADLWGDEVPKLAADVGTAQGFLINPGEGCETAMFGFLRRADEANTIREWFWHCSCKTQYASVVSEEHFVRCHKSLVSMLDFAIQAGVEVVVFDEGGYWEARDEQPLVDEVQKMNRLVAALAGRLSDAGVSVEAPIFEHRRFEKLEMGDG